VKTVVVLSGKGGAGKTVVTAGLLPFVPRPVLVDADVDASNLPLLLDTAAIGSEPFIGGQVASVRPDLCTACLDCVGACRFGAMVQPSTGGDPPSVDRLACEGCAVCRSVCPAGAVELDAVVTGEWYLSETRFGPMLHASLGPGGESSGALVTKIRREATRVARRHGRQWILVDGPPGIGCPIIASLSGADLAVVVTEPTPSGESDLFRVLDLAQHFNMKAAVVVNKADLHPGRAEALLARVESEGVPIVGSLPYDGEVSTALRERRLLADCSESWRERFERLWTSLEYLLSQTTGPIPASDSTRLAMHPDVQGGVP
jgi:MinD superfamily P-loop ATPase